MAVPFTDKSAESVRFFKAFRSQWDVLILQGQPLPGIAVVTAQRHQKVDLKQTPGADMSTMTNLGTEPALVMVKLQLWTPEEINEWSTWVPRLEPRPGKARKGPVSCYHPALAMHRINSLWVKTIGLPQPSGTPGILEVQAQFWEWAPTLKVGNTTPLTATNAPDLKGTPQAFPAKPPPSATENHP